MSDYLSFECISVTENAQDGAFTDLLIIPLINYMELLPSKKYRFDPSVVLSQGVITGAFDPFTCSCGDAHCAGIWQKVKISVTDGAVIWLFPIDAFKDELHADIMAGRKDLTLAFEIDEYKASLARLAQLLVGMEKMHGTVNYYPSNIFSISELAVPVQNRIERDRQRTMMYFDHAAREKHLFGELHGASVLIEFSNDAAVCLSVEDMLRIANIDADPNTIHRQARLAASVGLAQKNSTSIVQSAKNMTWESVWEQCWIKSSGGIDDDLMSEFQTIVAPLYASAKFTLVYADTQRHLAS